MWIIILVVTIYLAGVGYWLYIRFFRNEKSVVKLKNPNQFSVEHNGHTIVIDYDHLKNKVLVEFNENGMIFKVIDGLFDEPVRPEVREEEIIMSAPVKTMLDQEPETLLNEPEAELDQSGDDQDDLDLHKIKAMGGNIGKF